MFGLSTDITILLIVCLVAACAFEFINGFHDTANAVATVIYTKSLKPSHAVIWSGIWNFLGVYMGGIAVAMGIINLLPSAALVDHNAYHSMAMILALIITAIIWNLGTWYFGLPCSSSHTLIGSIFGVGIAYSFLPGVASVALNWSKVKDAGLSLLISPVVGFGLTLLLMMLLRKVTKKNPVLFDEQPKKKVPPIWIRSLLILTCTSVSYSHGSNDGQKGVGLIMIILISLVPTFYAIDSNKPINGLQTHVYRIEYFVNKVKTDSLPIEDKLNVLLVKDKLVETKKILLNKKVINAGKSKIALRDNIIVINKETQNLISRSNGNFYGKLNNAEVKLLKSELSETKTYIEYAPWWVILLISLSLGLGTMIGWKQIVVTVGEKIGKSPLTYAQGASAQFVAAGTIQMASALGLPVSTTHVLSSGVAGSMVAQKGLKNLRKKTVQSILVAWVITLPVTMIMAGLIFLLLRYFMA